jgi:PAS domain S-box-containing protein
MSERNSTRTRTTLDRLTNCREVAQAVIETVTDAVLLLDDNLRILVANGMLVRLFHLRDEEILGRLLFEARQREWDLPELRQLIDDVSTSGRPAERRMTANFSEVGRKALRVTAGLVHGTGGGNAHIVLAIADVTELERVLDERQELEERYETLVDTAQDGIWTIDASGNTTSANRAMAEMLRHDPREYDRQAIIPVRVRRRRSHSRRAVSPKG